MIVIRPRCGGNSRPAATRIIRPAFEALESRLVLYSTLGASWANPVLVTYSIVPDGTSIGGVPSNLQQTLNVKSGWQQQVQKAAAIWEAVADIDLAQVPDDGSPIGSIGDQQGDSSFGDIRIGGMSQSAGQLAFAYAPPPFNGGTNAGDIFFNTAQSWQTNGTTYDLLTVAIHEFGHALGMSHSAIASAEMYASYTGAKQALTSDDTAGIQSIYSTRKPDAYDAAASNNTSSTASDLTRSFNSGGQVSLASLDITSGSDVDWYKITVPTTTKGTMSVTMQSSKLSSLVPSFTLYNGSLATSGTSTGKNFGDAVSITASVKAGQTWYIKAMAGVTGAGGVGAYGIQINVGSGSLTPIASPNTFVAAQSDQNPTTSAQGTGWTNRGGFTLFLPEPAASHAIAGLSRIAYGTVSGYGDGLEAGDELGHGQSPANGRGAERGDRQERHDRGRDGSSPAAISPPSTVDVAAGLRNREPSHRPRGPVRADPARLRAVDAALAGWRPERPPSAGSLVPAPLNSDSSREGCTTI